MVRSKADTNSLDEDGLTQAFLKARGTSREISEGVMSEVIGFAGGSAQADDISLVCAYRKR